MKVNLYLNTVPRPLNAPSVMAFHTVSSTWATASSFGDDSANKFSAKGRCGKAVLSTQHILDSKHKLSWQLSDDLPARHSWSEAGKGWYKHEMAPGWLYKEAAEIFFHVTTESLWKRTQEFGMLRLGGYVVGVLATFFDIAVLRVFFYVWITTVHSWHPADIAVEQKSQICMPESRFAVLDRAISPKLRMKRVEELRSLSAEPVLAQVLRGGKGAAMAAKCGVTYDQLLEFDAQVRAHYGKDYQKVNIHNVVQDIIKPICTRSKMSWARWVNCGTNPPEAVVTHCWDEPFSTFLGSMKFLYATWKKKPVFFVSAFSLLQTDDPLLISQQLGETFDNSPFALALSKAKYFVVIVNLVVNLYGRAWCLLEIAKAMQLGFLKRDYQAVFLTGRRGPRRGQTSILDARATRVDDLQRVRDFVHAAGVKQVDELIHQFQQFDYTDVEVLIVNALSGDVCDIVRVSEELAIAELKNKLTPKMLQHASKEAKLKLLFEGMELHDHQRICDFENPLSALVCEPPKSGQEAIERNDEEALVSLNAEVAATTGISNDTDDVVEEKGMSDTRKLMPSISALSAFMLACASENPPKGPPDGYVPGFGCFGHEESGVMVRSEPIHLTPISDRDIVLYHYTDHAGFSAITGNKMKHIRASYAERAHFGDGVYASLHSPDFFGSKENILLNNYTNSSDTTTQQRQIKFWQEKGVADYCLPLIVSRDLAVNVCTETTREMTKPGHTLMHGPIRKGRDIWVVVIFDGSKVVHGYEDVDSVHHRWWKSDDFSMRLDAVEIFAGHAAMGDSKATANVLNSLHDYDFHVRIAAVWATVGSKALRASEKVAAITELAQNEPVEVVLDTIKEALSFIDEISGLEDEPRQTSSGVVRVTNQLIEPSYRTDQD